MTDDTIEAELRPVQAPEAAKLFDRPTVTVPGYDEPVIVLTQQERHDIAKSMMTLEHRLRAIGDHRRIKQIIDQNDEGDALGRIVVDMAADMVGIDEASRVIVEVLADRLRDSDDGRERGNGVVLAEALRKLRRDPKSVH